MRNAHGMFCDECHLIIAPYAPRITDDGHDYHGDPNCYKRHNLKVLQAQQERATMRLVARINGHARGG